MDQKFIEQLLTPHPNQPVLTVQQCRILLTDIACCSLMRLDITSMDKLWDLMVMLFKWQVHHAYDEPKKLLEITFRHMDGIGQLLPEIRKKLLIDATKRRIIEFWDMQTEVMRYDIMCGIKQWLNAFNVKISILIRLGFQRTDGTFETDLDQLDGELYRSYMEYIGENVYARNNKMRSMEMSKRTTSTDESNAMPSKAINVASSPIYSHELMSLVDQLSIQSLTTSDGVADDANALATGAIQQQGNILLLDDVNCAMYDEIDCEEADRNASTTAEFVHVLNAQSTLQKYLEQFRAENKTELTDDSPDSKDEPTQFDATEELLKMLNKD